MNQIETRFGERDKTWTILGVEFGPAVPQIWFPENVKNIVIQLSRDALEDDLLACYQLAHEAVHLLAPNNNPPTNVLEEGLAVKFSEDYVFEVFGRRVDPGLDSYREAGELVRNLLNRKPSAISDLRAIQPNFYEMDVATFLQAGLEGDRKQITSLLQLFQRETI